MRALSQRMGNAARSTVATRTARPVTFVVAQRRQRSEDQTPLATQDRSQPSWTMKAATHLGRAPAMPS